MTGLSVRTAPVWHACCLKPVLLPGSWYTPFAWKEHRLETEDIEADLLRRADGTLSAPDAARMLGTDVVTHLAGSS
jgi:hypothetical protein